MFLILSEVINSQNVDTVVSVSNVGPPILQVVRRRADVVSSTGSRLVYLQILYAFIPSCP